MKAFSKNSNSTSSSVVNKQSGSKPFFGVQAKLAIGKPNDKYEKEADTTADKVVAKSNNGSGFSGGNTFFPPVSTPSIQKVSEEEIQTIEGQKDDKAVNLKKNEVSKEGQQADGVNVLKNKKVDVKKKTVPKFKGALNKAAVVSKTPQNEGAKIEETDIEKEKIVLPTENTKEYTDALVSQSPIAFVNSVKNNGQDSIKAQKSEQSALKDSLPEIEQPTGIPIISKTEANKVKQNIVQEEGKLNGDKTNNIDTTPKGKREGNKIEIKNIQPPSTFIQKLKVNKGLEKFGSDEDKKSNIKKGIENLPTSENVDTNPGEAPKVDLGGQADPTKNKNNAEEADNSVQKSQAQNLAASRIYRGENDIYPEMELELLSPTADITSLEISAPLEKEIPEVSPEVAQSFDKSAKGYMDQELAQDKAKQDEAYVKMEADQAQEHALSEQKIAEETTLVKNEQEAAQKSAKGDVNKQRTDWKKENDAVKSEFSTKSEKERKKVDKDIDVKTKETNKKVDQEYSKAKTEGDKKVTEANKIATEQKATAKKKSENKSWWDRAVDAVSSFFDKLKEALNTIFDGLRKLVKGLIEAAKKLANALIDLARDAIIGLIKAFGEILKAFVNVALAAFPKLRDKFNAAIDKAVNKAIDVVNKLAEGLKKMVSALLDALGAVLIAILDAYQAVFSFFLDVLEFLTVGLIKVLEFLWNLVEGAGYAPGEFFGALAKEAIGGDPSKPLDNFEVPQGQEDNWSQAMGLNPGQANLEVSNQIKQQIPDHLLTVLSKNELADNEVILDPNPAVELSPEILAQLLAMQDGGRMDLGGAGANAISTKEFQASAADASGYDINGITSGAEQMDGLLDASQNTSENLAIEEASTTEPDWKSMSDDQKLDHYLGEMLEPNKEAGAEEPKPSGQKATPTVDNSPEVLMTKTGRLSVGQRLAFMGEQMMTGLEVMWNKYKVWIISALVAALILAGVVAFFTGGAALIAAVDIIIKAMIIIFGAVAVYKASGHIWDYVKFAWAGDAKKAGQSLATALAVIVVEFFLDKILLGMAKVFKRIIKAAKAVVKSTRAGRKVFRGVSKVRRFAQTTIRKGVSKAKGSKLVVNMQGRVGKGVKKLSDLRQRILSKFKFKKTWFEKHGKWIELWADFNPKVLLIRQDGTHEFRELETLTKKQKSKVLKGDQIGTSFKSTKSEKVIVGDAFQTRFNKMTKTEQEAALKQLKASKKATKRTEGLKGSRPEPTIKSKFVKESDQIDEVAKGKKFNADDKQAIKNKIEERTGVTEKKTLIKNSEETGELAVDAHAKANGMVQQYTGKGSRTLDKVYKKGDDYFVYEAKGGNSGLGVKSVDEINPATGLNHVAEQGTKANLEQTIKEMFNSGDAKKLDIAKKLREALDADPPKVKFIYLKQEIDGLSLGKLTVRQFNI